MRERKINWNLVDDFEDIKNILKALDITFVGNNENFKVIEYLLEDIDSEDEDINPNKWRA